MKYLYSLLALHIFVANDKMDMMMKKIFLFMAIALPFIFVSCSDDKDEAKDSNNHEWVDLGLPSGTLWATCNVGADRPEEYGDHFAWGETVPKELYHWSNYKWGHWDWDTIDGYPLYLEVTLYKYYYRNWKNNAYVEGDNKTELDPEDDAAYVNWGSKWRMPTLEQMQELLEYCDWQWTERNGVNGHLVTGPNEKTIFLPAAGGRADTLYFDGSSGYYWSRTLCSQQKLKMEAADQEEAYIIYLDACFNEAWYASRFDGQSVRPVRVSKQ